jgi:hypothetical protein
MSPLAKRTSLSLGGGEPTIQAIARGSECAASGKADSGAIFASMLNYQKGVKTWNAFARLTRRALFQCYRLETY